MVSSHGRGRRFETSRAHHDFCGFLNYSIDSGQYYVSGLSLPSDTKKAGTGSLPAGLAGHRPTRSRLFGRRALAK